MSKFNPFNNNKTAVIAIAIFVVSFLWIRSCEAAETIVEVGPTILSADYSDGVAIMLSERLQNKYMLGFGLVGDQTCKCSEGDVELGNNIMLQAQRLVTYKRITLGLGVAYWQNLNRAIGEHLTFALSIEIDLPSKWDLRIRHYSNAGSGTPNLGQDLITLGWRFD